MDNLALFPVESWQIFGLFTLGMIWQSVRVLKTKQEVGAYGLLLIGTFLIALLPSKNETSYDLVSHMGYFCMLFVLVYFIFFYKRVLPEIHEGVVLVYSAVFWYMSIFSKTLYLSDFAAAILLVISFIVACLIFIPKLLSDSLEILCYFWIQIIAIVLIISQYSNISTIMSGDIFTSTFLSYSDVFTAGMIFMSLGVSVMSLFYIIPIPGKRQSFEDRMKDVKEYIGVLTQRFLDKQFHPLVLFLFAVSITVFLILNQQYEWMSEFLAINLVLIFVPGLIRHEYHPPQKPCMGKPRIVSMTSD